MTKHSETPAVLDPFAGIKLKRSHRVLIDFLVKYPGASREKINERMMPEIEGALDRRKKISKTTNILTYLRKKGLIVNMGTDSDSHWNLRKEADEIKFRRAPKNGGYSVTGG